MAMVSYGVDGGSSGLGRGQVTVVGGRADWGPQLDFQPGTISSFAEEIYSWLWTSFLV